MGAGSIDVAQLTAERDALAADLAQANTVIAAAEPAHAKIDQLGEALAAMRVQGEDGEHPVDVAIAALKGQAEQLAAAQGEAKALKGQLTAQKGQTTKARAELAEAIARDPQAKARKLPADLPVISRDDQAALLALIDAAETVEVVAFADDTEEVAILPLRVSGGAAAFRVVSSGVVLGLASWEVSGPARITGWALFLDGDLSAWCERQGGGQLTIGAGQTFNLASDVIF
ncbi:hypothetical protein [Novosphingobium sp. ST904]|uniref:hypothetical protein n=1 Tax=Novosphingobium sp. ST904 TaxID=1684385 RepID=UPI0012E0F173|nr:hypothetical protein [Novosphingobium sp. ST904]